MDLSKILEALQKMSDNANARKLAWGAITVVGIWSIAQLVSALAPILIAFIK